MAKSRHDASDESILVTGGLGFIGRHLLDRLNERECIIDIVDNLSNNSLDPTEARATFDKVRRIHISSLEAFRGTDRYDKIYHLASPCGPAGVLNYPGRMAPMIIKETERVARMALDMDAKVLFISTSEVYGKDAGNRAQKEDIDRIVPSKVTVRLEYGVSKLLGEIMLLNLAKAYPLKVNIIRPFNIVGVGQRGEVGFVLPRFVHQALRNEPLTVFGDGTQRRTFTAVQDISDALVSIMESDRNLEIYNIGNPANELSVMELAKRVVALAGSRSEIKCIDPKEVYGQHYEEAWNKVPDIGRIQSHVAWAPKMSVDQIVREVIDAERAWMRRAGDLPKTEFH
jgi:nucleoside-diphosphate-sugar epimerase